MAGHARPATYRSVFAVAEFRALWAVQLLSILGDQLARVALSVLVFRRTGSPGLTAATYAISFLPWVLGGPLLSGYADRWPRRRVLVACDTTRAVLVAAMAIPHAPLGALLVLLFLTELLESPFSAARAAMIPDILTGDSYVVGSAVGTITRELGYLLGFAAGGAIVLLLHPSGALLLDALTFAVSAVVVRFAVRDRPAASLSDPSRQAWRRMVAVGREVLRDRWLRTLVLLAWLCAFFVVPEGLAVPMAHTLDAGPVGAGLLLAGNPAGTVLGSFLLARLVPAHRRLLLMAPLAALSVLPLLVFAWHPGFSLAVGLLVLSGIGSSYNLPANATFVLTVPAGIRGQSFGLVQSGMYVGQGLAIVVSGFIAQAVDPFLVVAGAGFVGGLAVLAMSAPLVALARRSVDRLVDGESTEAPAPPADV